MSILPTAAVHGEWFVGMRETSFRPAMTPDEREAFRAEWAAMHRKPWHRFYITQELLGDGDAHADFVARQFKETFDVLLGA